MRCQPPTRPVRPALGRLISAALLSVSSVALGGCSFGSRNFVSSVREELSAPGNATRLTIHNTVGDVTLRSDPSATLITAEIERIGRGSTQKEADGALDEIFVSLAEYGDAGLVEGVVKHPGSSRRREYAVNWIITAPPGVALDISAEVGALDADGFSAGANLRTEVGAVTLRNNRGGATVRTEVGDVILETAGPIEVRTEVGAVDARVLAGDSEAITIETDVGDVSLDLFPDWIGALRVRSDVGAVTLDSGRPALEVTRSAKGRFEARLGAVESKARAEITTNVGAVRIGASGG